MRELDRTDFSDLSDEQLIDLYNQSGNTDFINLLYQRYAHLIKATCYRYLEEEEASKDLSMEVFEKMIAHISDAPIHSFSNWLFIICRNSCISYLRSRKRWLRWSKVYQKAQKEKLNLFMENEEVWRLTEKDVQTSEQYLTQALEQLTDAQRHCIKLFFEAKMSYREVAEQTGYSLSDVKSHLQNGKRRLKKLLQQHRDQ